MSELPTIRVAAALHVLRARRTRKSANEGLQDGMLSHPRPPPPVEPCRGPRFLSPLYIRRRCSRGHACPLVQTASAPAPAAAPAPLGHGRHRTLREVG